MKRLCLILAYLFLFTQTVSAMPLLIGQKVVYRGTITDLRISAVDGTAFIDNLPYLYQSDFSAGVDGFTADGGTVAGNVDGIGGQDNVLSLTVNTNNSQHIARKLNVITTGKKYNVTFSYYLPSTNSILVRIVLFASAGWSTTTALTTQDSWTTVTVSTTATATGLYWYGANNVSGFTFQDAGGDDVFYIKDVQISEITPYIDGNHSIEIYDSSNRMLKGVLKAAGTSETTEIITDTSFDDASEWTAGTGWTVDDAGSSQAVGIAGTASYLIMSIPPGSTKDYLLKITVTGTVSAVTIQAAAGVAQGSGIVGTSTLYFNNRSTGSNYGLYKSSSGACIIDALFIGKVLTPSSSGATIVSAKGGTIYNFSYKNASFTYNAASYYVIIKAIR